MWVQTSEFGELFKNHRPDTGINDQGEEVVIPARTRAEFMRRFVNKEKKYIAHDWLATELLKLNHDSTFLSYSEASKMNVKDFFYILRSRAKYNELMKEQIEELKNGK